MSLSKKIFISAVIAALLTAFFSKNQQLDDSRSFKEILESYLSELNNFEGLPNKSISLEEDMEYDNNEIEYIVPVTEEETYSNFDLEVKPDFPGGMSKFYQYIQGNFRTSDLDENVNVIVEFIIEKDGSLTNIEIRRDLSAGGKAGKEVKRVFERSPKWKPGIKDNHPVKTKYILPVNIQIE